AHTGVLRDQQVAILSLRPVQYDPVQRRLRIARQLRVRILFIADETRPPIRILRATDGFEPIYQKGLLNPEQARFWRGRRIRATKRIQDWYDPLATYYKIRIVEDGLYRLDANWFSESGIVLAPGDLDRLQVFLDGKEIPLLIEDGGDGVLDTGDGVLFWGAYRRAPDRDFESEYGADRVYFLRIGRESGLRYKPAEDASAADAVSTHFLSRKHVEIDSTYEAMGHARNADRDHWFWRRTASPSRPGDMPTDVVMPVPLPGLAREAGSNAQIRLGMHSLTLNQNINPDHYAVVQIQDGPLIAEARWDGQDAHIATGIVPVSALSDTTYVVLRTPGDPSFPIEPIPYVDHVYFNWVEITYPRHFEAIDGMLHFNSGIVLSPRAVSIPNLEHERVRVLNLDKNKIISTVRDGEGIRFEIAEGGNFVAADETAIKTPELAERDTPHDLRGFSGADYVIIAGADFMDAAERLAAHRQGQGLSTLVVNVADVYDEFSFGQVDAEAIRGFVQYGFHTWAQRPVYVLLFGEFSFDYRNLFGQTRIARHNLVPGMPFQSPNRGLAFTDEFFGRVDDGLFMDVFVGRFSVRRASQANTVVQKVIAYDETPSAQWRNRILLMANWDPQGGTYKFIAPSDTLATITHAIGLENFKVYHDADTPPEPNASSREVIRQINEGRLIVNFMGHGSASSMSKFIAGTFQRGAFDYMSQIRNRERLPLFIGMSCLNGLYWDPRIISLAEEMTNKPNGGAIAYISASSLSF
ncbi:MAG: C25 family cysteine peptidase, partial [Gemmatimonadota bacterium]|nr:C25 family cysteine peptidase [Gemmatimonadota bacterium]